LWLKGVLEYINTLFWFSISTHKDIKSGIVSLRPGVNADMGLCQNGYPGDAAAITEMVQGNM